jgi:hypothetical protein
MMVLSYKNRIKYLEKKYKETSVAKDEILSDDTIRKINKTYEKNQRKRRIDSILNNIKNKDSIKEEVHNIADEIPIKEICKNCKEAEVIAIVILYVQRTRNSHYRIDRTALWSKYNLTWTKYSLIVERLLKWTREQKTFIKNDNKVDNEDFIRW